MIEPSDTALSWYMERFIPDPESGYAPMTETGFKYKYFHVAKPVTPALLQSALAGGTRVARGDNGKLIAIPVSFAVDLAHHDGWARMIAVDIDEGGRAAVAKALDLCTQYGLWAFADLSESGDHYGGHIWIPTAKPQPVDLLRNLSLRLQAAAGVAGEAYPAPGKTLRPPLMLHLRAPGGPRRFPLLTQNGELIDTSDPVKALDALKAIWQPNETETLIRALDALPQLSVKNPALTHKSKVNPRNTGSVIGWYNANHPLQDLLESAGVKETDRHLVTCPFHDDRTPSLAIFEREDGRMVCHCFSEQSGCEAAEGPYLDAFDVYRLISGLSARDAVAQLVERYALGHKREVRIEETQPATPSLPAQPEKTDPLADHQARIAQARAQLANELTAATDRRGQVTVISASCGLGKTHTAAQLANQLHQQGKRVAVVAPSLAVAFEEWSSRLDAPYIWQARRVVCTCYPREKLEAWTAAGLVLPKCQPGCPYQAQRDAIKGRIPIFQHNHLHLNDGDLLAGYDVVIVDESPLGALLAEQSATQTELESLGKRLATHAADDPALPLLRALWLVARQARKDGLRDLSGQALIDALNQALAGNLQSALDAARRSPVANPRPIADPDVDTTHLARAFFGRLLQALEHDSQHQDCNPLLHFALASGKYAWVWYERNQLLKKAAGQFSATSPAVIVLDGSADETVYRQLLRPWPVATVRIDAPISPTVTIIQCPGGASTRRIVQDESTLERATRAIASVCNELNITIDGGISYMDATGYFESALGGTWLYYGNQRGSNDLKDARTLAIIGSATLPPDAMQRQAQALWCDDEALDCTWQRLGSGDYRASDPRLQALYQLKGPEELRQAAHRCRPILSTESTTLLIFSPWDLAALGLHPNRVVAELPYGNSSEAQQAIATYRDRQKELSDLAGREGIPASVRDQETPTVSRLVIFQSGIRYTTPEPQIEKHPTARFDDPTLTTDEPTNRELSNPPPTGKKSEKPEAPPPTFIAWLALESENAERAKQAGNLVRAAWHQSHVAGYERVAA